MSTSLYERLGGAAALAAVVDDAFDRLAANPALTAWFGGQDLPQLKVLGVSALSATVGGPCSTVVAGADKFFVRMRFDPAELQAVVGDMTAALREQGIGMTEVEEIENLLYAASEVPSSRERVKNAG